MSYRPVFKPLAISLLALAASVPVSYADIGGIGSPVVPSNAPAAQPVELDENGRPVTSGGAGAAATVDGSTPEIADSQKQEVKPLLVIRFNQRHVYFDNALRKAVAGAEIAKTGVMYNIVSYVPTGRALRRDQSERADADASANLDAVLQGMQNMGVDPSRVRTATQSSDTITSQEVRIYAN